jgi:hypothetical protein
MTTRDDLIASGALRPREPGDLTPVRGSYAVLRLDVSGRAAALAHVRQGPAPRFLPLAELLENDRRARRRR